MNTPTPISYTKMPLDRANSQRKDAQWVQAQLSKRTAQIVCLHSNRNLIKPYSTLASAAYIDRSNADKLLPLASETVFLGLLGDTPYFAIDLSHCEVFNLDLNEGEFIDLRQLGPLINAEDAALLAYARGLTYWHAHNHFCANCGSASLSIQGGHARTCSNPGCSRQIFPRTDPAVIMLVEDLSDAGNPKCLLGRNKRFAARMFSTLAGFVDPGETLEETVVREVYEEAGISVGNVRYQASQPWPFPASIMLGFRATALSTRINTDVDEIEEAYWFSAQEVRGFGEWSDGGSNNCLPRKDSIARYLVDTWVQDVLR